MRRPSGCLPALSCIVVAGCANPEHFSINGTFVDFTAPKRQAIIQSTWPAGTLQSVATRSRAPASDNEFILAVIGESERQGTRAHAPCDQLQVVAIEHWPVTPVRFAADNFMVAPRTYLDHWRVAGCGTAHSWLLYDDNRRAGQLTINHTELPMKEPPSQ